MITAPAQSGSLMESFKRTCERARLYGSERANQRIILLEAQIAIVDTHAKFVRASVIDASAPMILEAHRLELLALDARRRSLALKLLRVQRAARRCARSQQ